MAVSSIPRTRALGVPTSLVVAVLLLAGCGDPDRLASAESAERGERGFAGGGDLCESIRAFASLSDGTVDDDPDAARRAAEEFRALAASAPPDVRGSFEVFADLMDRIADVTEEAEAAADDGDMGAAFGVMAEIMALMFDEEVMEAGVEVSAYILETCGFDPADGDLFGGTGSPDTDLDLGDDFDFDPDLDFDFDEGPGGTGGFGPSDDDPASIRLDDVEVVEEAHRGSAWVEIGYATSISNGYWVQLVGSGADSGFSEADALAACDALRSAFAERQPELVVEILNDDVVVARGTAAEPCAGS